jgi:small subunit ribosomal protein S17
MKTLKGIVISTKMSKTAVVEVRTSRVDPLYKKRVWTKKKYHVHTETKVKNGDGVVFTETRPISKTKKWKITEVFPRAEKEEEVPAEETKKNDKKPAAVSSRTRKGKKK